MSLAFGVLLLPQVNEEMALLLCALATAAIGCLLIFKLLPALANRNAWFCILWHETIVLNLWDRLTGSTQPERVLRHVLGTARRGDPQSVVDAIDRFCNTFEWAMNVGDEKGRILDQVVSEVNPGVALELGTYCGYSTVRIARLLKPGARLYTMESEPHFADIAQQVISFAGLQDQVEVLRGLASELIPELRKKFDVDKLDFVFIDHCKESYRPDIEQLESCGLLRAGTVLLADNVTFPGAPEYLDYVRHSPRYRSQYYGSHLEYTQVKDGLEKSVFLG
ncbi:catechol O-methyltransferase A-like [Scyliorhinus torazame]|uniref:catechol O-methyltransferase A-like n=1 Tax=Scyliorhinus torazame TaxID=75743 RepID=UPI003B5CAC96